jgi:hypothetical protein
VKRIRVLGGYGFFGGRIAERLAREGMFEVLVAGRSLAKAEAFCRARPDLGLTPARADRDGDFTETLRDLDPWLVIDAAGPFQTHGYAAPCACIETGRHYIDIADARAFVTGFRALDTEAKAAGVTLVSGASSVPALSGAVVADLARGLDRLTLVEAAITAGARAAVGRSVIQAILSYVGRPVVLRQAGLAFQTRGWRDLVRLRLRAGDAQALRGRWVAICDVPDLELLSDGHPDRPLVRFRAGVELAAQNFALWLLSWPVQWGWCKDLSGLAPLFEAGRSLMGGLGANRSGMVVETTGLVRGRIAVRRWTLIAPPGRGAETPCLAAPLLARRLAAGELAAGAHTAEGLLRLEAFGPDFDALGFTTERVDEPPRDVLYRRVMGPAFDALPAPIRRMHETAGARLAEGRARISRGKHPLARLVGWLMGFPPAAEDAPVTVRFFERDGVETWARRFGETGFKSRLARDGALLEERFGPLRFGFRLEAEADGLSMRLMRWRLGPLPMPLALAPFGPARETAPDGVFRFDVSISLPWIGEVVSYAGWLVSR